MSALSVLLIGTGPPMLLEGMARAKQGQKVIFVDQAATIGGSWKCPEVVGHFGVEVGVHLIENRPHTNAVFEALLEPSQRVAGNPDFGLMGKRRIPMRYARVLLYGGIAGRNLLKGKIERVRHSLKNMGEALRYRNLPFMYPKAGMAQVLNDLEARLKAHGAEFHFNRKIERLDVSQSGVTAFTSTGALSADHLVMSSRAHAPLAGLEHLWGERNDLSITSVVIKTEGPAPLFDGYVEIINDRILKRVRNVSAFATPLPEDGTALVVIQLRKSIAQTPLNSIHAHLIDRGLFDEATSITAHHIDEVCLNTLCDKALDEIAATHPNNITVLRTVDLGDTKFDAGLLLHTPLA